MEAADTRAAAVGAGTTSPSRGELALALGLALLGGALAGVSLKAAAALLLAALPLACAWLGLAQIGLLALVVYVPLEDFFTTLLPASLSPYARYGWEAFLWGLAVAVVLARTLRGRAPSLGGLGVPLAVLLAVAVVSAIANQVPLQVAALGLRPLLRYVALVVLLVNLAPTPEYVRRVVRAWLVVAAFVSAVGIAQAVVGAPLKERMQPAEIQLAGDVLQSSDRQEMGARLPVFATLGRYDLLGNYLMVSLVLAAAVLVSGGRRVLQHPIAFFGLCSACLVLSLSRQAWGALGISLALLVTATGRARWLLWFAYVAAALCLTLLVAPELVRYSGTTAGVSPLQRVFEPFSKDYIELNRHYYGRMFVIAEVGPAIAERAPVLGFGPGRFGSLASRFLRSDVSDLLRFPPAALRYVNDVNWVTLFGQLGALGVVSFALLLAVLFARLWRRAALESDPVVRGVALAACAAIPGWIFLGFMGPNFEVRALSFSIWLLAGLGLGADSGRPETSR